MARKPFDAAAARAELGEQLAAAEALAEKLDAEIGRLALAVVLDEAPESDLAGAREARAGAAAKVAELRAALVALGEREEAHAAAGEAAKREADEAEHKRLMATVKAAGTHAATLIDKLAVVAGEAAEAEVKALAIARRLDLTQRAMVRADLATLIAARLQVLAPHLTHTSADAGDDAERRLLKVV